MRQWILPLFCALPMLTALGCGEAHTSQIADVKAAGVQPSLFNTATACTLRGTVVWSGDLPKVPPFEIRALVTAANPPKPRLLRDNPNAPVIDPLTKGVAGAVIFLRKVDALQSRPWDLEPVTVVHEDRNLLVRQGDGKSNIGIVKRGDTITMVSREKLFNALHADGAAFFTLPFPDADKPLTRRMKEPGVVELRSAAGYYWMRVYLVVSDHPYVTRTDATGGFELQQVPPGHYQIVCWHPNWNKKSQDRDPESGLVTRMFFEPALEVERDIVVEAGGEARVDFSLKAEGEKRGGEPFLIEAKK